MVENNQDYGQSSPFTKLVVQWKRMIRSGWKYIPSVGWYNKHTDSQILRCSDKKSGIMRRVHADII